MVSMSLIWLSAIPKVPVGVADIDPCKSWTFVSTHGLPRGLGFENVAASSPGDAWAVGGINGNPLIAHWDGVNWNKVPAHDPETDLWDVAAISANVAWAVGRHYRGAASGARIIHWDGHRWSHFPGPRGGTFGTLYAVSAYAPDDIWAAGYGGDRQGFTRALAMHWDGATWTKTAVVKVTQTDVFYDIAATAPDDVWAVGYQVPEPFVFRPLIEHWDGSSWKEVAAPPLGDNDFLYGVSGTGPSDLWAVGTLGDGKPPLSLHWDGSTWTVVKAAGRQGRSYGLFAVDAIASDDAWAVGSWVTDDYSDGGPAAEHWDGTRWSITNAWTPSPASAFYGIGSTSSTDVWAVGYFRPQSLPQPLAEHSTGPCTSLTR
jgi:hypothetical protein